MHDAIQLLFGGLPQLGPGSDEHTLAALRMLPRQKFTSVVDVGCGNGRQTLALARELKQPIDAVDNFQPFLDELQRRAAQAHVAHLVRTHCLDMREVSRHFQQVDLIWSEGAAYNLGFAGALEAWRPALRPGGFLVVSECSWLVDDPPAIAREFWAENYPAMGTIAANRAAAEQRGYGVLADFTLPREAWLVSYYDHLEPRAASLLDHPDKAVRSLAASVRPEIEMFNAADRAYGYVFYLLELESL